MGPQALITMTKTKAYLSLARISNAPTVLSNVLVGVALAAPLSPDLRLPGVMLAIFFFYTAGMFLNDVCDANLDAKERPERPIPSGVVSKREAILVVVALFVAGVLLLSLWSVHALLAAFALVGWILLYDFWHKGNPISPLIMGLCRGTVYVVAFLTFHSTLTTPLWIAAGWMVLYILSLTWIARSENTNQISSYLPATLPFFPALYYLTVHNSTGTLIAAVWYVLWTVFSLRFVYRKEGRSIGKAIGFLIAGVSLLDSLILASKGETWGLFLAWSCFGATLFFQRFIKGT